MGVLGRMGFFLGHFFLLQGNGHDLFIVPIKEAGNILSSLDCLGIAGNHSFSGRGGILQRLLADLVWG